MGLKNLDNAFSSLLRLVKIWKIAVSIDNVNHHCKIYRNDQTPLGHRSTLIPLPLPAEVVQLSITLRKSRKQVVSSSYPLASCVIQ